MMKAQQFVAAFLLSLFLIFTLLFGQAQSPKVPGVVVNYIQASTRTYIGSPSICILPNGDYVASHDYFGPGSTEHKQALTIIYKSTNKGKSWEKISEIDGQFWGNLFVHKNELYIMGTWKHHGNFIIRKSLDNGFNWSNPSDRTNGLLLEGEYHTAPMPIIVHNGRLWRAIENAKSHTTDWGRRYSAMVISTPVNSDILNAKSWSSTTCLPYDSTYLNGKFGGWLEGNAVVTPEGNVVDILRVDTHEKGREVAAVVNISKDGLAASFDSSTGFMDFDGGAKKFSIRYDNKSNRYWTISNMIKDEFSHLKSASVRNTLVLISSSDLKNWTIHKVLLSHTDVKKHGFQYVDWQFDGDDIIYVVRAAYRGAIRYHDSNRIIFRVLKNYQALLNDRIGARG